MANKEDHKIEVEIQSRYLREYSHTDKEHYTFSYTIVITNIGSVPTKLLEGHWTITDGEGKVQEVGGVSEDEQPHLKPGESFQYSSNAVLSTPVGCMEGQYQMMSDEGIYYEASIPAFSLAAPNTLH